jgi:HK97 family phage portal protein
MNLGFGWTLERKQGTLTIDQIIHRLESAYESASGVSVTPETCLLSPTVQACIRALGNAICSLPVKLYRKGSSRGRESKEELPDHPVARLLQDPNDYQDRVTYWLDAVSWLIRYGNYYAFKARGVTGPIRRLQPLMPSAVEPKQADDLTVTYQVTTATGEVKRYSKSQIHHARLMSLDGVRGVSPVLMARDSIALELAAERFGGAFFGNGAMPAVVFQYIVGSAGHRTQAERQQFIEDFQEKFTGRGRFRAILLPKGIEMSRDPIALDADKAQFLQTRRYQRTVIAGALGVPPHLVGDLERATFNNVEQQSLDFVQNAVLPYCRVFEAAMERDLLTDTDRAQGVIIRFNLDALLRGDFASRQSGLKIQRENGVISPNDWREYEAMNPISADDGGDDYWRQGPSGQTAFVNEPEPAQPEPAMVGANGNGNGAGPR